MNLLFNIQVYTVFLEIICTFYVRVFQSGYISTNVCICEKIACYKFANFVASTAEIIIMSLWSTEEQPLIKRVLID
jgi:hypothetical protein